MPAKPFRTAAGLFALAAATVLTWAAWLGHERPRTVDPATGTSADPYSAGQVAGAGLTLIVLLVLAVLVRVPPVPAAAVMTVAFTAAWSVHAAARDETGLYAVGAVLVFAGLAAGTAVVALATVRLAGIRRRRTGAAG